MKCHGTRQSCRRARLSRLSRWLAVHEPQRRALAELLDEDVTILDLDGRAGPRVRLGQLGQRPGRVRLGRGVRRLGAGGLRW